MEPKDKNTDSLREHANATDKNNDDGGAVETNNHGLIVTRATGRRARKEKDASDRDGEDLEQAPKGKDQYINCWSVALVSASDRDGEDLEQYSKEKNQYINHWSVALVSATESYLRRRFALTTYRLARSAMAWTCFTRTQYSELSSTA